MDKTGYYASQSLNPKLLVKLKIKVMLLAQVKIMLKKKAFLLFKWWTDQKTNWTQCFSHLIMFNKCKIGQIEKKRMYKQEDETIENGPLRAGEKKKDKF